MAYCLSLVIYYLMLKICLTQLTLIIVSVFLCSKLSQAQPSGRPIFDKKNVNSSSNGSLQSSYNLNTTFDELIDDSNTYDPRTLWIMKSLTDITQPFWDPMDVDFKRNDRAVEKAFTMQSGRHLSMLVKGSELKSTFEYLKRSMQDVKSYFNYSIQSDGDKTYVSKDKKGKKLLELSMEFNISQGLDPNIKLGQHLRFRYDYVNKRPLLEFGANF